MCKQSGVHRILRVCKELVCVSTENTHYADLVKGDVAYSEVMTFRIFKRSSQILFHFVFRYQ